MLHPQRATPPCVSSLAEHLDLALAASEDLMHAAAANADVHIRLRLELTALTHVLQARQLATDAAGEGVLPSAVLGAFLSGTDALEATTSPAMQEIKPAVSSALIGGRVLINELRLSLASALAVLGEHYSLDPDEEMEEEGPAARSYSSGAPALWAHGPDDL